MTFDEAGWGSHSTSWINLVEAVSPPVWSSWWRQLLDRDVHPFSILLEQKGVRPPMHLEGKMDVHCNPVAASTSLIKLVAWLPPPASSIWWSGCLHPLDQTSSCNIGLPINMYKHCTWLFRDLLFEDFRNCFGFVCSFFDVFGCVWTCSDVRSRLDLLGHARIRWDVFRCVRMCVVVFGKFWKFVGSSI